MVGTLVEVDVVRVPRRMAMRWLVDDDGNVRPEYAADYEIRGSLPLTDDQKVADRDDAFANRIPAI